MNTSNMPTPSDISADIPTPIQEQNEIPNSVSKDDFSYYKELSRRYARKKISWDDNSNAVKDVEFYNKFKKDWYKSSEFLRDFRKSLSWEDLKKLLTLTQEQRDQLFEDNFSSEINRIWFIYENKQEKLKGIIQEKYSNLNQVWRTNVEDSINKIDSEKLDKCIYSPEELYLFVRQNSKSINDKPDKLKEIEKIFKDFSFKTTEDLKTILKNKNISWDIDSVLVELVWIINKIKLWESVDTIDIQTLFSCGIFNNEQKKLFLKIFLPVTSLQELLNLDIITKEQADNIKKTELIKFLKKKNNAQNIENDNSEFTTILWDLSLKDISIYTDSFIDDHIDKLQWSEWFIQKVTESFNKTTEEIKEKILSKVQTVDVFKKKLMEGKIRGKIKNSEEVIKKLQAWAILKITTKQSNLNFDNFIEIISFWDDWKFIWKDRSFYVWSSESDWRYNASNSVVSKDMYYSSLLDLLESDNISNFDVLTPSELKENIDSWKIVETSDTLWEPSKVELTKYQEHINDKIKKVSEWKTQEELEKDEEYKRLKEIKEKISWELVDVIDLDIKDDLNLFMLTSKIDELDPKWKEFRFWEWVSFKVTWWENEEFQIYTINNINKISKTIQIHSAFWEVEEGSYEQFFQIFKAWNTERISNNTLFSSLPDIVSKDSKLRSTWSDFKIYENKIVSKNEKNKATYNYLVQDKSSSGNADNVVKIWEISNLWGNQMVKVSFWKIKKQKIGIDKKTTKDIEQEYYEFNTEDYVTVACLENYIKKYSLKPETKEKDKEEKVNSVKAWDKPKWWFFKWYLSNKSVSEIIGWVKMWFKEFTEHLKSGNEEHQAKVALATWWKFMPVEVRLELKSRVETAEKKHMDEAVSRLKAIDTPDAISLIYRRLNYSNTEEYKKEAALIFMLEKYWNLYNKNYDHSPLNSKKWEFLWYKALSWNRWDVTKDSLYQEVKADCERDVDGTWRTRNFTEEELVWKLMKKQCSVWYNWIHRRSRLHKEVEKLKKAWIVDEIEDWFKKWNDTRNPQDILLKWIDEIKAGSPANAAWWLKKLVDRWDDMGTMNTIPMILIYSWLALTVPEDLNKEIKWMVEEGRCIPFARFISYPKDIKLAMKTIRVLSKKIQQKKPNLYPDIWDKAEELYQDFESWNVSERKRVLKAMEFFQKAKWTNWKLYSTVLTNAMYMLADWERWDDSELNSILITEKEKPWEDWEILKDYFNTQVAYIDNIEIKDSYMWDSFKGRGLSGMSAKIIKETLQPHSSGTLTFKTWWTPMTQEIKKEILAIQKRTYSNENDKKIWLRYYLKNIFAWLAEAWQADSARVNKLFEWVGPLSFFRKNWWITFKQIENVWLTQNEILFTNKWDWVIEKFVHNIINDSKWDEIDSTIADTLSKSSNILNWNN